VLEGRRGEGQGAGGAGGDEEQGAGGVEGSKGRALEG